MLRRSPLPRCLLCGMCWPEFLQCTICNRLFTSAARYTVHACRGTVTATVVARGCALAAERAPTPSLCSWSPSLWPPAPTTCLT
jgi:hypothetical protein